MAAAWRKVGTPLAVTLNPRTDMSSGERDVRLEDYLNDKIQTSMDFGGLSSLLASVELQSKQLEDQLQDARTKLTETKRASEEHTSTLLKQTEEFQRQLDTNSRRMMIMAASDSPEEAVQRLNGPLEKLRQLELAQDYVELLKDVDDLTENARQHLPADPKEALKPYAQLRRLVIHLRGLQEPTEGAAVHLIAYVEQTSSLLWREMKQIMSDDFEAVLQKMKWPELAVQPTAEWIDCFGKLLDLQDPEIREAQEPLVLLPMAALVKPFVQQFKYHFMGSQATNHPHNLGDYFFEWFLGKVGAWEPWLQQYVGPVLAAHFRASTNVPANLLYVDPVAAFITALLPALKDKVDSLLVEISGEPQYLSKFMGQLMDFDDEVRSRFHYDAGEINSGWKGLTWDVLDDWFDRWISIEERFALERYEQIIAGPDSGLIDYDSNESGKSKPTFGAIQISDLLRTVTAQYCRLRKFSHKLRFLMQAQLNVLDRYGLRLRESLEAYVSLTSPVGRTLKGYTKEEQMAVEGLAGLERLSRVYGSADHIISTLEDFCNDEFFVVLYDELEARAKATHPEANIAGPVSFQDVKESTSPNLNSDEDGTVFDVTLQGFKGARTEAEGLIVNAIKHAFPSALRPYTTKSQWMTIGESLEKGYLDSITTTPELDQPLKTLREEMAFLYRTLPAPAFLRIWRQALGFLEEVFWRDVLLKQDFTTLGAARLAADFRALQSLIGQYSNLDAHSVLSMPRLAEGIALLNLPVECEDPKLSLMGVTNRVFAGSNECEEALNDLGLEYLTNQQARSILQKRMETSS